MGNTLFKHPLVGAAFFLIFAILHISKTEKTSFNYFFIILFSLLVFVYILKYFQLKKSENSNK